jgi:hypothetical protein
MTDEAFWKTTKTPSRNRLQPADWGVVSGRSEDKSEIWFHSPKEKPMWKALYLFGHFVFSASLFLVSACNGMNSGSPTAPMVTTNAPLGSAPVTIEGASSAALGNVTDETLANAGWSCIQPGNGLTLCFPPGGGIPSVPPLPDNGGAPTYTFMAFTLDHQFVHRGTLRRPDLYHGEPCLGGAPWNYVAIVGYFECLNPLRNGI